MFDNKGEIRVNGKGGKADEEMLELIDSGAEDVEDYLEDGIQKYLVYVEPTQLMNVSNSITQGGFTVEASEQVFKPNILQNITNADEAKRVVELINKLEEFDDIQKVYTNLDLPEGLLI